MVRINQNPASKKQQAVGPTCYLKQYQANNGSGNSVNTNLHVRILTEFRALVKPLTFIRNRDIMA